MSYPVNSSPPQISIIVTCYNFAAYIAQCLDSLLAQTLVPSEILVYDDCSTDTSWQIIDGYAKRFPGMVIAHRMPENMGSGAHGLNLGLCAIQGNYYCWIDGDDRWHHQKLEYEWLALRNNPDAGAVYSNVRLIDAVGREIGIWKRPTTHNGAEDVFQDVFSADRQPNANNSIR